MKACRWITTPTLGLVSVALVSIGAQDRLPSMPGYEQSRKMQAALQGGAAFVSGNISPSWTPDARSFTYTHAGKTRKRIRSSGPETELSSIRSY